MEVYRCILFLAVDLILSVQNLDTGGKLKKSNFFPFFTPLFKSQVSYVFEDFGKTANKINVK